MAIQIWGKGSWESIENSYSKHEKGLLLLDLTKATEVLGWSPRWEFKQTIEKTVRWYRSLGDSLDQKNMLSLCEPNFRTLSVDHQLIGTELMLILVCGHYKWTAGLLILRSGSFTPKVW